MRAEWSLPARSPNSWTLPSSGWKMSMMTRIEVVLPAPLGPSRPKITPARTESDRPSTAVWPAKRLVTRSSTRMGAVMLRVICRRGRRREGGPPECYLRLHGIGQRVPGEQRALDAHRELGHAGERPQVPERLVLRRRLVPLHHRTHPLGEGERLRDRTILEELRHHRR